ncbi:hypothetical protein Q1695_012607 [Nippostrongylus brasiliensis]|nr:hypothetical protein Q1695_012607 [Nippostrongylus brasiliensis]
MAYLWRRRSYLKQRRFLAAPEYGLATCQIEKSLSTVRDAIFCYLDNPQLFEENKRILHNEFWSSRFCGWENYHSDLSYVETKFKRKFLKFAIIRHPVERFLSGYVDKCLQEPDQFGPDFRCLGCARDMQCFLEKLFHLFYRMSSKREYLRREVWYVARHFAPQTWYCDFKESLKGYVLFKYYGADKDGEMTKFLRVILSRVKVEQKRIDYIIDGIVGKNTAHSTTSLDSRSAYKRQLLNNGYLCRLIVAIYYHDFLVFNFEDPATLCFHSTAS